MQQVDGTFYRAELNDDNIGDRLRFLNAQESIKKMPDNDRAELLKELQSAPNRVERRRLQRKLRKQQKKGR